MHIMVKYMYVLFPSLHMRVQVCVHVCVVEDVCRDVSIFLLLLKTCFLLAELGSEIIAMFTNVYLMSVGVWVWGCEFRGVRACMPCSFAFHPMSSLSFK